MDAEEFTKMIRNIARENGMFIVFAVGDEKWEKVGATHRTDSPEQAIAMVLATIRVITTELVRHGVPEEMVEEMWVAMIKRKAMDDPTMVKKILTNKLEPGSKSKN